MKDWYGNEWNRSYNAWPFRFFADMFGRTESRRRAFVLWIDNLRKQLVALYPDATLEEIIDDNTFTGTEIYRARVPSLPRMKLGAFADVAMARYDDLTKLKMNPAVWVIAAILAWQPGSVVGEGEN